jgi:hypothetical protein
MTPVSVSGSMSRDDSSRGRQMVERLLDLAERVKAGASPNPTALLCIRNTKLSGVTRLRYRERWIADLIERRRAFDLPHIVEMMQSAHRLVVARQANLSGTYLARNRELGASLGVTLRRVQPGVTRLSHYCSRRTGPDSELLAVEFYARALDWPLIDGAEDYIAAMYCICRSPNLRFRLTADAAPKLRALAKGWAIVCAAEPSSTQATA